MPTLSPKRRLLLQKIALVVLLLVPLAKLVLDFATSSLGANPVEALTHSTGLWALRILLLTLTLTPLRIVLKWRRQMAFRRLLGLTAFFYAVLHFMVYLVFDQELSFAETLTDVAKRPYITVGFAAFLLFLPLVFTSTDAMIKRLGGKRWRQVHRLVYAIAILTVIHFLWLVKKDITDPATYGAILLVLLAARGYEAFTKMKNKAKRQA